MNRSLFSLLGSMLSSGAERFFAPVGPSPWTKPKPAAKSVRAVARAWHHPTRSKAVRMARRVANHSRATNRSR